MALSSDPEAAQQPARGLAELIETVRVGATEVRRREPHQERVDAARLALLEIRRQGIALSAPLADVAEIVLQVLDLACQPEASRRGNPGFYVEAAAADLSRLASAIARGEELTPLLDHARTMLVAARQAMPRPAAQLQAVAELERQIGHVVQQPHAREVFEIDLSDREQVERLLAAAGTAPTYAELNARLELFGTHVDSLSQAPHGAGVPAALLDSAVAVRATANAASQSGLGQIFQSAVAMLEEYRREAVPLSPDAVELLIAARRVAPLLLNDNPKSERGAQLVKSLAMQADALLLELRSSRETHDFWPERESGAEAEVAGLSPIGAARTEPDTAATASDDPAVAAKARPSTLLEAMRLLEPAGEEGRRASSLGNALSRPSAAAGGGSGPEATAPTIASVSLAGKSNRAMVDVASADWRAEAGESRAGQVERVVLELGSLRERLIALGTSLGTDARRGERIERTGRWTGDDEARAVAAALTELGADTQLLQEELARLLLQTPGVAAGESYALRAMQVGTAGYPGDEAPREASGQTASGLAFVIDDSPSARLALSGALTAVGWEVRKARDGRQARSAFASARPDVILIDVALPQLSAIVAAAATAAPDAPLIGLLPHDGDQAHVPGVSAYLTKPIEPSSLFRTLNQIARRGH